MAKPRRNEQILLYNLDSEKGKQIYFLCIKLGIRIRRISSEQLLKPVGFLAGLKDYQDNGKLYEGVPFPDEMMVFINFSSTILDGFLAQMHKNKIPKVALKAVLTPTNASWDSITLHDELMKEHKNLSHE